MDDRSFRGFLQNQECTSHRRSYYKQLFATSVPYGRLLIIVCSTFAKGYSPCVRVSVTGFMLTTGFIFATSLAAQQPPKGPDKKDPKIPETKVDQASENKWPTVIAGKKLDDWVKDMQNRDPSTREMVLRTVVFFGPSSREAASVNLLHARDPRSRLRGEDNRDFDGSATRVCFDGVRGRS